LQFNDKEKSTQEIPTLSQNSLIINEVFSTIKIFISEMLLTHLNKENTLLNNI